MGSFQYHLRRGVLTLLVLAAMLAGFRAGAQGFGLAVSNIPAITPVNTTILYTVTVSNLTGLNLSDYEVTNTFSSDITFTGFSTNNVNLSQVITNENTVLFLFTPFTNNEVDTFSFTIQTPTPGFLTNNLVVATVALTNTFVTNLVNQVITAEADLAVSMNGPPQAVITNDITYYTVGVTNLGPSDVPNVFLTNTLPAGLILKSVVPASPSYTQISSNLVFSLGTVTASNGLSFQFNFQPTNVAISTFTASVGAPNSLDPNPTNNIVTTNFSFISYLPGQLTAVTNSAALVNPQNGLLEQNVLISNTGTTNVPAVRLVITGLNHQLYNAVGTNVTNPFVYYSAPLAIGNSVVLRVQYNPRTAFPFTNTQLHAFSVPTPSWPAPAFTTNSTNLNVITIVRMKSAPFNTNNILLEFPTATNRTYTIVYSDNAAFSNAMVAPPQVVPPANFTQWIDYGPPTTISAPAASSARFYRVYLNPQ